MPPSHPVLIKVTGHAMKLRGVLSSVAVVSEPSVVMHLGRWKTEDATPPVISAHSPSVVNTITRI